MTDQDTGRDLGETTLVPVQTGPPAPGPWAEYLAAAQRLDAVRRASSAAQGEQQASAAAARQELAFVRARLAPQHARFTRDFGVPELQLQPQPADREYAARTVAGGPAVTLAALRQARTTADAADAAIIGPGPGRPLRPWARNLLVYGPFSAVVLIVQLALYLIADHGSVSKLALGCGLTLPVIAFGMGYGLIGFVFGNSLSDTKVDRTPIVGAVACLVPILLTCSGVVFQRFF